jgi:hypothetical protein
MIIIVLRAHYFLPESCIVDLRDRKSLKIQRRERHGKPRNGKADVNERAQPIVAVIGRLLPSIVIAKNNFRRDWKFFRSLTLRNGFRSRDIITETLPIDRAALTTLRRNVFMFCCLIDIPLCCSDRILIFSSLHSTFSSFLLFTTSFVSFPVCLLTNCFLDTFCKTIAI